jgi:hypothetical protein
MKQTAINGGSKQEFGIKCPDSCNLVEGKWIYLQYFSLIAQFNESTPHHVL